MNAKIVTKSEFARSLGVSPPAVSKAIKSGRISVLANGRIDYESALKQWRENSDPETSKVVKAASNNGDAEKTVISDEAMTRIKLLLSEQGVAVDGPLTIQLARTAEVISRTEERQFRLAVRRGEYLPKAKVLNHFSHIAIGIKKAFQNLPIRHASVIAAELGVDAFRLEQLLRKAIDATLDELAAPIAQTVEGQGL